jgi:hypothetical protein
MTASSPDARVSIGAALCMLRRLLMCRPQNDSGETARGWIIAKARPCGSGAFPGAMPCEVEWPFARSRAVDGSGCFSRMPVGRCSPTSTICPSGWTPPGGPPSFTPRRATCRRSTDLNLWAGASQALSDPILNCSGDTMPSTKPESQSTASRSFLGRCRHVRWDLSPNGQQELRGLVGEGSQA